jgi:DNA-binding NarL/FixJ family response regulator
VEDQIMLRDTLEHFINAQADMGVVGVTADASKAPELCRSLRPDLILMDVVTEHDADGIAWAGQIRQELPEIKIVIMSSLPELTFINKAREAGAHSYINKNAGKEHLLYTIRSTMNGFGIYPGPVDQSPFAQQFTEKEIAVIRLVCKGKSRSEAAEELGMAEATIKPIITSILNKSGFDSISKFAIYAASRGLIAPDL